MEILPLAPDQLSLVSAIKQHIVDLNQQHASNRKKLANDILKLRHRAKALATKHVRQVVLDQMIENLAHRQATHREMIKHAEQSCLELCFRILQQLLSDSNVFRDELPNLIHQALSELANSDVLQIRVHPDNLDKVRAQFPHRIEADPTIDTDQAVIEGVAGEVSVDWRTRLDFMKASLNRQIWFEDDR